MKTADIVILGNGVLGMSLACELLRTEGAARLAVVGPPTRPGSASLAAGAMINVWAEMSVGALDDPALAGKLALGQGALDLWDAHARSLEDEAGPVPVSWGTCVLDAGPATGAEEGAFDHLLHALHHHGVGPDLIPLDRLPFLDPAPDFLPQRAVRVPDGRVDSRRLLHALDRSLRRHPACDLIPAHAIGLEIDAAGDKLVRLDDGQTLRTRTVVLANGAHAQALVDGVPKLRNGVPRLLFGAGSALDVTLPATVAIPPALDHLDEVVRTLDRGLGCGVHLIPLGDRSFYCGSTSHTWITPEPRPRLHAVHNLLQALRREIHGAMANAMVALRGPGYRPVSADGFPLLGESDVRGVWFCNGTKRDGLTTSPVLARELARAIAGRPHDLPELFRPSRPLISYRTREHAIEAAVQARVGSDVINGLLPTPDQRDARAARHRRDVTAIYDRRGIADFGIHPELLHLYASDEAFAAIRQVKGPTVSERRS